MRALLTFSVLACGVAAMQGPTGPPPPVAPPEVALKLETRDGRSQYHRGEIIPLRLGYTSEAEGKFVKASLASDLQGGQPQSLRCEPAEGTAPGRSTDQISLRPFLWAQPKCRLGVGAGFGTAGGCLDCHGFLTLGPAPLTYEMDLNREVRLLRSGHYQCTATSGDITFAVSAEEPRPALRVVSNVVGIDIADDPAWSQTALAEAKVMIQASCDDDPSPPPEEGERWLRCTHAAEGLRYLDIDDSLRAAVLLLQGNGQAYWQTEMWDAITQSSNRKLAIELLSQRMLESDFAVTEGFLQTLGGWRLQQSHPEAFSADGKAVHPEAYSLESVRLLRASVRALGESLPHKQGAALAVSAQTYEELARWQDCQLRPLIPESETRATLAAAGR
jgi:hypothetical protein